MCEQIIADLDVTVPDTDPQGDPITSIRHSAKHEKGVFERFEPYIEEIEDHYNIEYRGTERPVFEWHVEEGKDDWKCGNSEYLRKKWVRVRDRDLTCVAFMMDHQSQPPFDPNFEVMGGKLEFAQHGFGFQPERGTLVVFPSDPHFLHRTAPVLAGELFQIRFHIAATEPFLYQPTDFPGDFRAWLKPYMS
jgi:hypothetical protein